MKTSGLAHRDLSTLFEAGLTGGLLDAELLERFAIRRDEAAFEALVRRHGPLVWRVCRLILRHHHDAEDAFQATFHPRVRQLGPPDWASPVVQRPACLHGRRDPDRRQAGEAHGPRD
jgi:Sigma-70 region 2